jgi:hypothetical protein
MEPAGMNHTVQIHARRATMPPEGDEFVKWIALDDVPKFLRADLTMEDFALYSSVGDVFMHAVLVPAALVSEPDYKDLMEWNFNPHHSGWGLCYAFNPPRVWLEGPLSSCGSKTIEAAEQLVFVRTFEDYEPKGSYVEIVQRLLHVFDLHFLEERDAYCRLDRRGDLEDVISIISIDDPTGHYRGGTVVTIRRAVLDEYMAVTDSVAVRMFDITRFRLNSFSGWSSGAKAEEKLDADL